MRNGHNEQLRLLGLHFAYSYSENSHERANEYNMLQCIVQSFSLQLATK